MPASTATRIVLDALRSHLDPAKWACVEEVERIDLLAVGVWRSTGYRWHGFEVKVSRGDWLRELRKPGKNQAHLCHGWSVATLPGLVKPEELPGGWGHIELRASGGVTWMRRPTWQPKPLDVLVAQGDGWGVDMGRLLTQAAVARRASYAEADARALVRHWPGTPAQLTEALSEAQRQTGRVLPGIGVYGRPDKARIAS